LNACKGNMEFDTSYRDNFHNYPNFEPTKIFNPETLNTMTTIKTTGKKQNLPTISQTKSDYAYPVDYVANKIDPFLAHSSSIGDQIYPSKKYYLFNFFVCLYSINKFY
jgi:hypothetical protein